MALSCAFLYDEAIARTIVKIGVLLAGPCYLAGTLGHGADCVSVDPGNGRRLSLTILLLFHLFKCRQPMIHIMQLDALASLAGLQ